MDNLPIDNAQFLLQRFEMESQQLQSLAKQFSQAEPTAALPSPDGEDVAQPPQLSSKLMLEFHQEAALTDEQIPPPERAESLYDAAAKLIQESGDHAMDRKA